MILDIPQIKKYSSFIFCKPSNSDDYTLLGNSFFVAGKQKKYLVTTKSTIKDEKYSYSDLYIRYDGPDNSNYISLEKIMNTEVMTSFYDLSVFYLSEQKLAEVSVSPNYIEVASTLLEQNIFEEIFPDFVGAPVIYPDVFLQPGIDKKMADVKDTSTLAHLNILRFGRLSFKTAEEISLKANYNIKYTFQSIHLFLISCRSFMVTKGSPVFVASPDGKDLYLLGVLLENCTYYENFKRMNNQSEENYKVMANSGFAAVMPYHYLLNFIE